MVGVGDSRTGTCKWFDVAKGFGFITIDGEETDIFVHQTEIYAPGFRSLAENEKLEFKISSDDRTGARLRSLESSAPAHVFFAATRPHVSCPCWSAGKLRAVEVTGPDGAYVQGAPREYDNQYGDDEY